MSTSSSLSKYRNKMSQYENPESPTAPLTSSQQEFLLKLTHSDIQKPIPEHLKPIPKINSIDVKEDIPNVNWEKFNFNSKHEFSDWLSEVDRDLDDVEDKEILDYIHNLEEKKKIVTNVLLEVGSTLDELKTLEDNYYFVSNKTNSLHQNCEQLINEQNRLENISAEVESNLSHFLKLERIVSKLASPSLLLSSDQFFNLLEQIDECLSFMVHNPNFKESGVYSSKYRHCLHKGISLMKSHVTKTLQEATVGIQSDVQNQNTKELLFPLIYGNFSASIAKLKRIFREVEERRNGWTEYAELYGDFQESFFRERETLLNGSVRGIVEELNLKGRSGFDLCLTVRIGTSFAMNLAQDEFRLFGDFFQSTYTPHFDIFTERIILQIYDTLRPLLIKVIHLETLAELCTIFRTEIQEATTGNPNGLNSFINILQQLLQDTQERLVYRSSIYINTDIRYFNPSEGDLAYPQKLEMMEQIQDSLDSNSQSSLESMDQGNIDTFNIQIPRPLKSASSPADLHGMWYPSLRRTLLCLSKLHRSLDKGIFQGLSQEALAAVVFNLSSAAEGIAKRSTLVDAQLFEIKHLLILREQIAPFQTDFAVKETSLDFSRVKMAALSLLQKKKQLFSLSGNNSLLEFIVDGTPGVKEYFLDSKKDVDKQLKGICEKFIQNSTQLLIGPLQQFIQKAKKVSEAQKEKPGIRLNEQSFGSSALVAELIQNSLQNLKIKLPNLYKSMRLYLANKETEFILFRPIKNNLLNGFLELETIINAEYNNSVVCPSQDHLNSLISSLSIAESNYINRK